MRPFRCTSCGALCLEEFCELQHHRATPVTAKGGVWSPRFASSNGNDRRCRVDTLWSLMLWWDVALAHLLNPMCFCFPKCPNVWTHVCIWRSRVQGLLIWDQSETLPRISCANFYKFMSYKKPKLIWSLNDCSLKLLIRSNKYNAWWVKVSFATIRWKCQPASSLEFKFQGGFPQFLGSTS